MWIWMLACAEEVVPVPVSGTVEAVGAVEYVDLDTTPPAAAVPWLVLESGYEWDQRDVWLADLNGDGQLDMTGRVWGPAGTFDGVVFGPLDNTILPRDFAVLFSYGGWYPSITWVGEFTGEPPADVQLISPGYGQYIVPGPWEGAVVPDVTWLYGGYPSNFLDVDLDGTLDLLGAPAWDTDQLEVTYGPAERFGGPPDVTVDLCPTGNFNEQDPTWHLRAPGDIDGDGLPEISVPYLASYAGRACGGFTVSLPPSGHVNAGGGEATREGLVVEMHAAGDWNGDGLPDVLVHDLPTWRLLLSPVSFADGLIFPAAQVALDPSLYSVELAPFDRNGDGRAELLVAGEGHVALLDSTLDALAAPFVPQWDFEGDVRAAEQGGRGWVVFMSAEAAWAVDVGAAQ